MPERALTIGLVRRGYSATGGAEAYLKRLGRGLREAGHSPRLFTSAEWPAQEWRWGPMTRLRGETALRFADELAGLNPKTECDVVLSLERVWSCDIYRAGDGIHKAWMRRRAAFAGWPRRWLLFLNSKHREILELEAALFSGGAGRVIANSEMVKREAQDFYRYPAERIEVIRNGVPVADFRAEPELRESWRKSLGLGEKDVAVLFVGSGWERKGLRFAVEAVQWLGETFRLLIAGRGPRRLATGRQLTHLDPVQDLPALYGAADIFLLPTLYDPFSNACLEALAAGLPVITTRDNGFSEVIENAIHGTIINSPADVAALREALLFWADADRRRAAQPQILARASEFDLSRNLRETLALLSQAASAESVSGKMRKT